MKKLFIPFLCFVLLAFVSSTGAWNTAIMSGGSIAASSPVCSQNCDSGTYDIVGAPGDNESFEGSEDNFCTASVTKTEPNAGTISTYDSTQSYSGTYAMSISQDLDTASINYVQIDLGTDNLYSVAFFFRYASSIVAGATFYIFGAHKYSGGTTTQAGVAILNHDSIQKLRLVGNANWWVVSPNTWYHVDMIIKASGEGDGLNYMQVRDTSGNIIQTDTAADELTDASGNDAGRYFSFNDDYNDSTAIVKYIDNVRVNTTGSGYIGICE